MAVWEKRKNRNQNDKLMRGDLGFYAIVLLCLGFVGFVNGLGSMSTIAAPYGNFNGLPTVCAIVMGSQGIQCVQGKGKVTVYSTDSFVGITAGENYFCGLKQGGNEFVCWTVGDTGSKKTYQVANNLEDLAVEGKQICGLESSKGTISCWAVGAYSIPRKFVAVSGGSNFTCGLLSSSGESHCWGRNRLEIVNLKGGKGMRKLFAGGGHVCGIRSGGAVSCWGRNDAGQTTVPSSLASGSNRLALGNRHTCAIRKRDSSVVCWGATGTGYSGTESFETIVAGDSYTCGLLSRNLLVLCWGGRGFGSGGMQLSLPKVLPGPCTSSACSCGVYRGSKNFCGGSQHICNTCNA